MPLCFSRAAFAWNHCKRLDQADPRVIASLALLSLLLPMHTAAQTSAELSSGVLSIRSFGVSPTNTAALNRTNLQKAIDSAAARGAALYVEPTDEPYPIESGLVLRMNVSLIGVHGPVGRGTRHPDKAQPVGQRLSYRGRYQAVHHRGSRHSVARSANSGIRDRP